jgi:SAM-dependent methyltransferase
MNSNNVLINKEYSKLSTRLYFLKASIFLTKALFQKLSVTESDKPIHHEAAVSREKYDNYGERELADFERNQLRALYGERLVRTTFRQVRNVYIKPVCDTVAAKLDSGVPKVRLLEVGCGNATNLKLIKERFGDKVELAGIDLSENRIKTGKSYWGNALSGIDLNQADATRLDMFDSNSFDIVYSICALEQVTYRLHEAVSEMIRVSSESVICVEPVFEFGNRTQRLYNIVNDQCRTLLSEFRQSGSDIHEGGLVSLLHNPLNPVGILIANKKPVQG